jgi:SAM-dependent methyltransferase
MTDQPFTKLNLGSGRFKKVGYLNVDWVSGTEPELVHDLNRLPYPLADNRFKLIEADHVLEHLDNAFAVMKELHRIARPGATIIIRVPHWSRAMTHPEHQHGFDFTFPFYFNKNFQGGYQGVELRAEVVKLTWLAQRYLKKRTVAAYLYYPARPLGAIFDFLANLSPMFCSRIWCFWVGGFEEIEFRFRVVK